MKKHFNIPNIFTLLGAFIGLLYWNFYSFTEGCAITSKWYGSIIFGGLFGNFLGGLIVDIQKKYTN
ncbi:MAG: hypothetical protein ACPGRC_07330 [Salibacteraceae bacterium]